MDSFDELRERRDLYLFTVAGANGRQDRLVLPVPTEEVLAFLVDKVGALEPPVLVSGVRAKWKWFTAGLPSRRDHAQLYEAIASLLEMQVPLLDSVAKAVEITSNLHLQYALACSITDLQMGHSLAEAFGRHPKIFDRSVIGQLTAAQKTAGTAGTLRAMATHIEMTEKVRSQTLISMLYPAGVATVLYLICGGLLYFLMPKLTEAFTSMQVRLNVAAQALVWGGKFVHAYPVVLFAGPVLVLLAWIFRGPLLHPGLVLLRRIPIFGAHFTASQLAVSSATLAGLLKSGITLHEAVGLVADTTLDPSAAHAFRQTQQSLEAGDKPPVAFSYVVGFFGRAASDLRSAIQIGNETSSLPIALANVSTKYERAFLKSSEALGKVIEPLATVFIGVIVGAIVMTAYFPILSASNQIK